MLWRTHPVSAKPIETICGGRHPGHPHRARSGHDRPLSLRPAVFKLFRDDPPRELQRREDPLWQDENRKQPVPEVGIHRSGECRLRSPCSAWVGHSSLLQTVPAGTRTQRGCGGHRSCGPSLGRIRILGAHEERALQRTRKGLTEAGVSTGLTCVHETRDMIVTLLLKVIMPQRGRIGVYGRDRRDSS